MKNLRAKNIKLEKENQEMNIALQSTIVGLQKQMTAALSTALQKRTELENKLGEAETTIVSLQNEIEGYKSANEN